MLLNYKDVWTLELNLNFTAFLGLVPLKIEITHFFFSLHFLLCLVLEEEMQEAFMNG